MMQNQQPYISQRSILATPQVPDVCLPRTRENFCPGSGCPASPVLDAPVASVSTCQSGCPNCSSLQQSLRYRTDLDRAQYGFYNQNVLPRLDTDLIHLSFAK